MTTIATQAAPSVRRAQMDGLRALCFLAVFAYHADGGTPGRGWFGWGYAGVHVFFALSGYLIIGILSRIDSRDGDTLPAYYSRRAARILPAYLAVIVFVAVGWGIPDWPWYLAMASNYKIVMDLRWPVTPIYHFWTLAVEWQFYLIFPLIYLRCPARLRTAAILACIAASKVARTRDVGDFGTFGIFTTPVASEYIFWGCLAACLPEPKHRCTPAACLAIGAAMFIGWTAWMGDWLDQDPKSDVISRWKGILAGTPDGIGAAGIVYGLWWSRGLAARILSRGPIAYAGMISYGLYAYHAPVLGAMGAIGRTVPGFWRLGWAPAFLLTFVAAAASWRYMERPIMRIGRGGRRVRPLAPMATAMDAA